MSISLTDQLAALTPLTLKGKEGTKARTALFDKINVDQDTVNHKTQYLSLEECTTAVKTEWPLLFNIDCTFNHIPPPGHHLPCVGGTACCGVT
jgi:hypothetical protein